MKRPLVVAFALSLLSALPVLAQGRPYVDKVVQSFPLDANGLVLVENANGTITVVGTDRNEVRMEASIEIRGVDDAAVLEGRQHTKIGLGGDGTRRVIRTHTIYPVPGNRWVTRIAYRIEVPRQSRLTVNSFNADIVEVSRMSGFVSVKSAKGPVRVTDATGGLVIDAANGTVTASFSRPPTADTRIYSVNAPVEVRMPKDSKFAWVAETLKGDFFHGFALEGDFETRSNTRIFRGRVNGGQRPVVQTTSITSQIHLLPNGASKAVAQRLVQKSPQLASRPQQENLSQIREATYERLSGMLLAQPTVTSFAVLRPRIDGDIAYQLSLGNIVVGDVRGSADFFTRAGEIIVGRIFGAATLTSQGGPINIGDVFGPLHARTAAGDVHVRMANAGGLAATDGGSIEVGTAGKGMTLLSGGGDIRLRRATSAVRAETRSGDISVIADPALGRESIDLKTHDGSVTLNLPPDFSADIDAVVMTSSENQHRIESAIPGLSIVRDRVGDKTRIRAFGKINGGGERIRLQAENGNIVITARPFAELVSQPK
jgi:DUF4097 and DUF4098 domain-containing protein YvlB